MTRPSAPDGAQLLIHRLHHLVIDGPRDLEIASAMAAYGYDAVKWAEGQALLAELVAAAEASPDCLDSACGWYYAAADTARDALAARPLLLSKVGLARSNDRAN
jgi:hypothetical protein